ncbi:magnesium chelatase subunit H [Pseudahrensia aquimaris]|uniref:magnesium chelatase n=1 Tax=Pseudahrensia aquimaris TaxID=744461 RepID=A0ABW3FH77_9HYPH
MKRNRTSAAKAPINVVLITLDNHMSGAVDEARTLLRQDLPGLNLSVHAATDWHENDAKLDACKSDIAKGDIIVASMLFVEDHVKAILPDLEARRDHCDAMVCCMSSAEVVKNTRIGKFDMGKEASGITGLLKKLRGKKPTGKDTDKTAGERQMKMLRRLPKVLKYIPGTAQDVRAYFLTLQYRLAASSDNISNMVRMLVDRYSDGARAELRGILDVKEPADYPETGVYHPAIEGRFSEEASALPTNPDAKGTVGLLLLRSYLLSGDTGHYDGVIRSLEARGLNVIPCFCNGLDMRPAIDAFLNGGRIDAMVSLTGFSLVGGPAYSDAKAAAEALEALDVPYITAHVTEFQSIEKWESSGTGLLPIETTIMVAIPELDGGTGSIVYGGRHEESAEARACSCARNLGTCPQGRACMQPHNERVEMLSARTAKLIALRKVERASRRIVIPIFAFPPNAGNLGTAAFLAVFESLFETLKKLSAEGYSVEVPESVDALRDAILKGNASEHGALANVHDFISAEDHVRREPHLAQIEEQWGPAPGRDFSNGSSIFVLGKEFGNIFVAIQPGFGYEGDPMRLLFEKGFAPTHAFSAFYRYLREDWKADAVLHFGTHGALEFMPGKQVGMSAECWPDRLIGDLPNFYLYAANNPSEGTIAKRRSAATLVSYLTPPLTQAGLYRGLNDLKTTLDRLRALEPGDTEERDSMMELVEAQAEQLDLKGELPKDEDFVTALTKAVLELEYTLIPHGLHTVGKAMDIDQRREMLTLMNEAETETKIALEAVNAIIDGETPRSENEAETAIIEKLTRANTNLSENRELDGLVTALDGRFVSPSPSGDLLRTPDMLPTGRNIHGFDPFSIPSSYAVRDGARQAAKVLQRHLDAEHALPETIALVLWGTDNLKSEGGPMAQALALMGAKPRLDSYGRVCGAELIPLDELKRPRIDCIITLSGIFRDLLPMQASMLAEASYLAAIADEPADQNFIRKHALAHATETGCDLEQAALRVFSNAEGAYGSNVNYLISSSAWTDEGEIADTYTNRKCFAITRKGKTEKQPEVLNSVLAKVDMAYQNLDSVELGVTTIDHYFDTLGGISKAVTRAKGKEISVYISDQTQGEGRVRTLGEQVSLETRTRSLNPKWFEGMLEHGYEGVRQIEAQITNTMGWSATTGEVQPWIYQQLSETFVLDEEMRKRLSELNPAASSRMVNRLIEASERDYWQPDDATLDALRDASDELEDALEGVEA